MGVGVGMSVGVDVSDGDKRAVGARVSIGRGVTSGWGGGLTHAARPIDQRISQDHFATFTTRAPYQVRTVGSFGRFPIFDVTCSTLAGCFSGALFSMPATP